MPEHISPSFIPFFEQNGLMVLLANGKCMTLVEWYGENE